jgi:hypothetical protein
MHCSIRLRALTAAANVTVSLSACLVSLVSCGGRIDRDQAPASAARGGDSGASSLDAAAPWPKVETSDAYASDATPGVTPSVMPGMCTDLVASGPIVTMTSSAGPPPDFLGGPLVDGVYDMTEFTYYNGAGGGGTERETIRISGGGTQLEYQADHSLSSAGWGMVISIAPSAARLNDKVICPANEPWFNMFAGPSYTAVPGQFVAGNPYYVKVYRQRP